MAFRASVHIVLQQIYLGVHAQLLCPLMLDIVLTSMMQGHESYVCGRIPMCMGLLSCTQSDDFSGDTGSTDIKRALGGKKLYYSPRLGNVPTSDRH